ncbi:MAG: HDOD domain-containing protein [Planctomycetes bacterium]|nr:HDOD domain-containing protein [Planctomycetota bacterium]
MRATTSAATCEADLARSLEALARLPAAAEKILGLALHEGSTARHIAAACASDPELSGRILRLASSPVLGCRQPVGQLLQAAVVLGMNRIRNLVLAAHIVEALRLPAGALDGGRFFRHAFAVASLARALGQAARSRQSEDMYLAGLLHDVGIAVFLAAAPEAYAASLERVRSGGAVLEDEERELFGIDHAEAGCRLASRWPVDRRVATVIRFHAGIGPGGAGPPPECREAVEVLVVAELVCRHHGWGLVRELEPLPPDFVPPAWLPLSRGAVLDLFGAAATAADEVRRVAGVPR